MYIDLNNVRAVKPVREAKETHMGMCPERSIWTNSACSEQEQQGQEFLFRDSGNHSL